MKKFQVYERNNGAWSQRFSLMVGYCEEWVLDKTTDSATDIKVSYHGKEPPKWDIMDWCRLIECGDDKDTPISYLPDGRPDNHSQYVIWNIVFQEDKLNEKWIIDLTLIEPIERFNGILGETLSYTNQTEKVQDGVTYRKDAYNHFTALERWLKVTPANCDDFSNRNGVAWWNRIKIMDEAWLRSLPFADTTFNELTLYGVLMDVYDSSTGRTPVAYFDMNPETDLPYNAARDEYLLKFERQDGFDKEPLLWDDLIHKSASTVIMKNGENYATGLVSNVENLVSGVSVNYPAQGLYAVPEVDSDVRNTTTFNQPGKDWVIVFPCPIKNITKVVELKVSGYLFNWHEPIAGFLQPSWTLNRQQNDLTELVYEKKTYDALASDPTNDNQLLWFREGENKLHVKRYYWRNDDSTSVYYIEYEPLSSGRIIVGDENYVKQINQTASQVGAQRFSAFLNQYADGMNKADIVVKKTYYGASAYKDHFGRRVLRDGKEYIITKMSYRNRNFNNDVFYQLNENHFRKSNSYQASQRIRTNIAIPYENLMERKTAIRQRVQIGLKPVDGDGNAFLRNKLIPLSALLPTGSISGAFYPQLALVLLDGKPMLANVAQFQFGNQVVINCRFIDNASAGKRKTAEPRIDKNEQTSDERIFPFKDVEYQIPVLFTDPFGEVKKASFYISSLTAEDLYPIDFNGMKTPSFYQEEFERTRAAYQGVLQMPLTIDQAQRDELAQNACIETQGLNMYKDALEMMNVNVVIEVLGDNQTIVCEGLLQNSRLMQQDDGQHSIRIRLFDRLKSENDNADGLITEIIPTSSSASDESIIYEFVPHAAAVQSAMISYADGTKLLIINENGGILNEQISQGQLIVYYA